MTIQRDQSITSDSLLPDENLNINKYIIELTYEMIEEVCHKIESDSLSSHNLENETIVKE